MAISITESQGTKVYLVEVGTDVSDITAIETAKAAGKQIGCIQDEINITTSRGVTEYTCLTGNESAKSIGSITLPNFSMNLLFDAANTEGQAEIRNMYANNTRRIMILELNDMGTTNPTYITFESGISSLGQVMAKDTAVMQNATVEICSTPDTTLAA